MQVKANSINAGVIDLIQCERTALPLVVDLDGTLTQTDTLHELLIQMMKQAPIKLLLSFFDLIKGKAAFKKTVANHVDIDPIQLPWRHDLIDYLKSEKAKGRPIILATAAHITVAQKVANHLGIFDKVLATESGHNLKGTAKLQLIRLEIGEEFTYAGDSKSDLPIWQYSTSAILVGANAKVTAAVKLNTCVEREFFNEIINRKVWFEALRIHQWLKNLLLFVPLLTAFSHSHVNNFITMCVAFFAFSIAASGTYVLNDLWDLKSDRQHPRKYSRPLASATLPILHGLGFSISALLLAFVISIFLGTSFTWGLLLYVVLTTVYSLVLKPYVLIDVLMLSFLYTLRIIAGSMAVGISVSSWLLAFSVFIFLSLALVKRCAELVTMKKSGTGSVSGRDYRVSDLVILWPMGVGAALSAVVVFGLFISAPETQARYASPQLLWPVSFGLIYWLARLWIKTSRGEMHDDPVVYAIKDPVSCYIVSFIAIIMLIAQSCAFERIQ